MIFQLDKPIRDEKIAAVRNFPRCDDDELRIGMRRRSTRMP